MPTNIIMKCCYTPTTMDKIEASKQIKMTIPIVGEYGESNWKSHTLLGEP